MSSDSTGEDARFTMLHRNVALASPPGLQTLRVCVPFSSRAAFLSGSSAWKSRERLGL
jgi:hypothetical protein